MNKHTPESGYSVEKSVPLGESCEDMIATMLNNCRYATEHAEVAKSNTAEVDTLSLVEILEHYEWLKARHDARQVAEVNRTRPLDVLITAANAMLDHYDASPLCKLRRNEGEDARGYLIRQFDHDARGTTAALKLHDAIALSKGEEFSAFDSEADCHCSRCQKNLQWLKEQIAETNTLLLAESEAAS